LKENLSRPHKMSIDLSCLFETVNFLRSAIFFQRYEEDWMEDS
jgi:hypothetical protein